MNWNDQCVAENRVGRVEYGASLHVYGDVQTIGEQKPHPINDGSFLLFQALLTSVRWATWWPWVVRNWNWRVQWPAIPSTLLLGRKVNLTTTAVCHSGRVVVKWPVVR